MKQNCELFSLRRAKNLLLLLLTYMEVLSFYKKLEGGEFNFFDNDICTVKFLVLPTLALHPSQPDFD